MRKICIFLCAVLLLVTSVCPVQAAKLSTDPGLIWEAEELYKKCLKASGRESFHGYCGMMTSYQLWLLGINKSFSSCDGNKQFDKYKNLKVTSGGFNVKAYSAQQYTLREALDKITNYGKKNVRNLLVGFEWTNTRAGAYCGHAVVVNAIENGTVYFTESFDYAMGRMEGEAVTCTIPEFVAFFADWTVFDGVILFGERQYANRCATTETDTYLQLRFDSNLRSQPCLIGENDCLRIRNLQAGEVLHTTGILENEYGDLFYRVEEGETVGYVSANAVFEQNVAPEGWFIQDGLWYYYENGTPCEGWVVRVGVSYYLGADGSVTTGWAEVDGQRRYFSSTGALCRGWGTDNGDVFYLDQEGIPLTGLQNIEGTLYFFGLEGIRIEWGEVIWEGKPYTIKNGIVTPKV